MKSVDVEATVEHGGPTGQAGAIKLGIANSLTAFVPDLIINRLRLGKSPRFEFFLVVPFS